MSVFSILLVPIYQPAWPSIHQASTLTARTGKLSQQSISHTWSRRGKNGVARELAYGTMATPVNRYVYVHVLTREILRINLLSLAIKESIQVGHFKVFQNRVY